MLSLSVTNTDISLHRLLSVQIPTYEYLENFKSSKYEDVAPSIQYVASRIFWSSLHRTNWQIISFIIEQASASKCDWQQGKRLWFVNIPWHVFFDIIWCNIYSFVNCITYWRNLLNLMLYRPCIVVNCIKSPTRCTFSYTIYSKICTLNVSNGYTVHHQLVLTDEVEQPVTISMICINIHSDT